MDPANGSGVTRFDRQFWRANVDPSERYVLSLVDTSIYRLHADQSGFSNLFLAGDWLKTGLDAGCVEAAVMGGMQASRAICGVPQTIPGERGWWDIPAGMTGELFAAQFGDGLIDGVWVRYALGAAPRFVRVHGAIRFAHQFGEVGVAETPLIGRRTADAVADACIRE